MIILSYRAVTTATEVGVSTPTTAVELGPAGTLEVVEAPPPHPYKRMILPIPKRKGLACMLYSPENYLYCLHELYRPILSSIKPKRTSDLIV